LSFSEIFFVFLKKYKFGSINEGFCKKSAEINEKSDNERAGFSTTTETAERTE